MEILDLCGEAIDILAEFAAKGSRLVLSDAATGAMICHGAMCGAAINVRVNTGLMKDREYAAGLDAHVQEMMDIYLSRAERIYADVTRIVTGA